MKKSPKTLPTAESQRRRGRKTKGPFSASRRLCGEGSHFFTASYTLAWQYVAEKDGIDLANSMVGVNCKLMALVKVDSRFRGNDGSEGPRRRRNNHSGDSRMRGMSYTPPSPVRGEEFGVRIPDSAWEEKDARVSNHPIAQSPIAPLHDHPITQSPDRSMAQCPDLPIPPAPVTHFPISVIARARWENEAVC